MKIVTVIGARPQFIKAAAVSDAILRSAISGSDIEEVVIHTGQHYDPNMSDVFFNEMNLPKPKYFLNINGLSHGAMTGQMLEEVEKVLLEEKPDWVLVYGDTNSTLAGALAASKLHIKIAHVEAGLRSFNMRMPEEVNRILTDRVSTLLLCPTRTAVDNLVKEGYNNLNIDLEVTGDVMLDASNLFVKHARKPSFDVPESFILSTIHRAENTDDKKKLSEVFRALNHIAKTTSVVLPLHPRTKNYVAKYDIMIGENVHIIDPVGYLEMIYLLQHCNMIFTDSGGLQKEAYFFKKVCVTLREETEWVELIEHGANTLVGSNYVKIMEAYHKSKNAMVDFEKNLYGNGDASDKIVRTILNRAN
jgi:UDP-GlcNAc3NAcA epimerase